MTLDAGKCKKEDLRFTFIGRVGRVVKYDTSKDPPIVSVTFNDGRTSYDFDETWIKMEYTKSMYGKDYFAFIYIIINPIYDSYKLMMVIIIIRIMVGPKNAI